MFLRRVPDSLLMKSLWLPWTSQHDKAVMLPSTNSARYLANIASESCSCSFQWSSGDRLNTAGARKTTKVGPVLVTPPDRRALSLDVTYHWTTSNWTFLRNKNGYLHTYSAFKSSCGCYPADDLASSVSFATLLALLFYFRSNLPIAWGRKTSDFDFTLTSALNLNGWLIPCTLHDALSKLTPTKKYLLYAFLGNVIEVFFWVGVRHFLQIKNSILVCLLLTVEKIGRHCRPPNTHTAGASLTDKLPSER